MLNWIIIAGRLTRDPELRYTQSNTAVASFTLAVDRDYSGGKDAGKQTDFIDVVAWRHDADFAAKYFRKGLMALVSGRLQSRKWQTKDGANRTAWEIQADHLYFAERREQEPAPHCGLRRRLFGSPRNRRGESLCQSGGAVFLCRSVRRGG